MKKQLSIFALALVCFCGLSVLVTAQDNHGFNVTVPFGFVASGKTMAAGKYRVSRVSGDGLSGLILSNFDNRDSVIVLPTAFDDNSAGSAATVSFEQVGDDLFLNKVETESGVYSISTKHSVEVVTGMKHRQVTLAATGK